MSEASKALWTSGRERVTRATTFAGPDRSRRSVALDVLLTAASYGNNDFVEILLPGAPLLDAMYRFGLNILGLSIIISGITAASISTAALTSTWLWYVTHEPSESSLTLRPLRPRRRYCMGDDLCRG